MSNTITTQTLIYSSYPEGLVKESDFTYNAALEIDSTLQADEILVELLHLSVDPYMRGRMSKNVPKGYFPAFEIGKPINGGGVAKVLKSNHENFKEGDVLLGYFDWQKIQKVKISGEAFLKNYVKIDASIPLPLSYYLGVLGMPGMTAYFGFLDICQPKEGEVVVVSAASGAVGSLVGQLAKIKGCKVIGISGSTENVQHLKDLGFDEIINYKDFNNDTNALKEAIEKAALPKTGVDCYFDNVGGFVLDAVTLSMNRYGRISCCGSISEYNGQKDLGPRLNSVYVVRELKIQGFIVGSFYHRLDEGVKAMTKWVLEGKLKVLESKVAGLENIPKALIKLFTGDKVGKMIIDV
ncbi:predicted protein [Naegleria gruberi]|uniref:Predicted protein n=1 Tax=Naegleria gruberi TaxID=5762 RepID=D2W4L1_NAEGR|nr:uncharacterized protein NAEGRDRAFT_44890 [Naegleria gruberi]EFC35990.1 predicted protein [Naegleria gruberi]|eukprot:XP_002668734.1 predicted protein [Naegleria gruberi strain NEG-M]